MAAVRDGHMNARSFEDTVARTNLVSSATATGADDEHLAVVVAALIEGGGGMRAASEDR
jgi:hypothetical protein